MTQFGVIPAWKGEKKEREEHQTSVDNPSSTLLAQSDSTLPSWRPDREIISVDEEIHYAYY